MRKWILIVASSLTAALLACLPFMEKAEYWFGDIIFMEEKPVDNRIKIIGIDEKSLREIGAFSEWSRQQAADLLNSFDPEHAPAVIAFDINYFGDRDSQGDTALVLAAAKFEHVVMASYVEYTSKLEQLPDGSLQMNTLYVEQIEKPYEALRNVTVSGFTNVVQDKDNYVRRSLLSADDGEETEYGFAWQIYACYKEWAGEADVFPEMSENGIYGFDYTAEPGMYEIYSYTDVLNGKYDPKIFKDSIVLVGAYSQGMMDQYMVPVARGAVMNGVEVQANHVNALLSERTYTELPDWLRILLAAVIVFLCAWLVFSSRFPIGFAGCVVIEAMIFAISKYLYSRGSYWRSFLPVCFVAVIFLLRVAVGYATERFRKRKILNVFRTYMAPQVVDELGKSGNYEIELGGQNREIAVLFVDIRGFSSLSEGLLAEDVVGFLNRYLGLVTEAIFKNEGTLDKFIGDAVMAVYNAPLDIEDYWYKAVQTGLDIIHSVDMVKEEIKREFGIEIACGVGIHCGSAVVGNIGCSFRMDYTAIGDTVNVAERLESIAKRGQVLISSDMYEHVKDRYKAVSVGKQSLKGRRDLVEAYLLEDTDGADTSE